MIALIANPMAGRGIVEVSFAFSLLIMAAGVLLLRGAMRQGRLRRRINYARGVAPPEHGTSVRSLRALPMTALTALGRLLARSGILPARTLTELGQTLAAAGFRGAHALWLFLGVKVALFFGGPLLVLLLFSTGNSSRRMVAVALAAAAGLLLPDMAVRRIRTRHASRLQRGLPDALDLLVICAQAGLGLVPAIERVSEEMRHLHPAIAFELELTAHELRINSDTRVALLALGRRTGLDGLKRLTATLSQSLQYGTPLSTALRMLAAEMRQEALTRFEERAARLPVLLTLPMMLFIMPCVFVVVGGPAVIRVMHAFSH